MTDTTPAAVERLARVLDEPFYRVEGYGGPYIDEATLRDEHTAAAATLRAQQARIDAMRDDIITLGAQVNSLMRERDAALAQVVQAATLPSRYGAARIQTVQRDFNALRAAIRAHDSEAAETAWDRCERWLGLWPLEQTTPPAPAPSTPVDNKISADPVGKEG